MLHQEHRLNFLARAGTWPLARSPAPTRSIIPLYTVVSGTTSRTETFDFTTSISFVSSSYSSPYEVFTVTCYAGGTEILTEHGAVPIETIKPADKVLVRRNGQDGLEPVTWVGSSSIDLRRHARPETAAPIRIKASALADNVPARDLFVSPEHCLVLNGR